MHKILFIVSCLFLTACGEHETGYYDGYQGKDEKQWLIFGRAQYKKGFQAGRSEAFQDDWFAENLADMYIDNSLQCEPLAVKVDPLIIFPDNWKRTGTNIFEIN